jgi:2-polyprenyl-3-methyl-5-hydroxy-6-metoxy-1,4-benzoquinol methylase
MIGYSARELRNVCLKLLSKNHIKAEKLMDLGGGTGEFTKHIANCVRASRVFIVDISREALSEASKHGFETLLLDASKDKLPFQDQFFDMVSMVETIEHLIDPDHAIKECKRILKKDGVFLICTPNLAWWVNRLVMLFGYQPYYSEPSTRINVGKFLRKAEPYNSSGHVRLFTFTALYELLRYYGFKVVDSIGAPGDHNNKILTVFDKIISKKVSMAADIALLALKVQK